MSYDADTRSRISQMRQEADRLQLNAWVDWETPVGLLKKYKLQDLIENPDSPRWISRLDAIGPQIKRLRTFQAELSKEYGQSEPVDPIAVRYECQERVDREKRSGNQATEEVARLAKLYELHRLEKELNGFIIFLTDARDGYGDFFPNLGGPPPNAGLAEKATEPTILWAVVIGIEVYSKLPRSNSLPGSHQDGKAIKKYLREHLLVPEDNIRHLTSSSQEANEILATRANIISTLNSHLRDNTRIKPGEPALIYFSGHGSNYELRGQCGVDADGSVEAICPADRGGDVLDISDRELNLFLTELRNRTSNITIILDSCFSGGAARDADEDNEDNGDDQDRRPRALPPIPKAAEDMLRAASQNRARGPVSLTGLTTDWKADMAFAGLSACQDYEVAWEGGGQGDFTRALLVALKSLPVGHHATYVDLTNLIKIGERQHPMVYGTKKGGVVFKIV